MSGKVPAGRLLQPLEDSGCLFRLVVLEVGGEVDEKEIIIELKDRWNVESERDILFLA